MASNTDTIRADFAAREDSLKVFDVFSGTQTSGENGAANLDDPNLSVSEASAIATLSSLGLMGVSKGFYKYGQTNKMKPWVDAVKPRLEALDLDRAIQASQESGDMTKLMELLPKIGTVVKRFNFESIWDESEKVLKGMRKLADAMQASFTGLDNSYDTMIEVSDKAYKGFKAASVLGATATTLTAVFHDRALPFLDEFEFLFNGDDNSSDSKAQTAFAEVEYRMDAALGQIDARLIEVEELVAVLPDFQEMIDLIAESEKLLDPISGLVASLDDLSGPYGVFLGLAEVISAPISGVLDLFESPPKVLPTITGYKTITKGFWDPITTTLDPLDLLPDIWVPAVKVPIPGFKELFNPIPREEVSKIIDLILKIAGLPLELLEKALSPILSPLQGLIDDILRPIFEKANPFSEFIGDYDDLSEIFDGILNAVKSILSELQEAFERITELDLNLNPIEEVGALDAAGMETFFGSDTAETIKGVVARSGGGFLDGAVLHGNGGNDIIEGTDADDLLSGGSGNDILTGLAGDDILLGGDGADDIDGGAGQDVLLGGAGDDILSGGLGNDTIDGGAGSDTLEFLDEEFADFDITATDAGIAFTRTVNGSVETDLVRGVEEFVFSDQSLALDDMFEPGELPDLPDVPDLPDLPDVVEIITPIFGSDGDDLIKAVAARASFLNGGGGADVFEFKESVSNGAKELNVIEDFELNEDMVRIAEGEVVEMLQTSGGVMLILSDDGDAVYLRGDELDLQDMTAAMEMA